MHLTQPTAVSPGLRLRRVRAAVVAEIAMVFAVFFLQGAWPAPDVNEACYLGKTKHYWNPDWVQGDLFLDSADAHAVFYWLAGWPSLWLSLPVYAWAGRLATWWLLAWGWQRLSFAVVPRPWLAVLSAGLFVCLQERCQMAGEWVIGGFEAKGLAYALVFFGLAAMVRNRSSAALALWGAASSLHVLVGGWTVVAAGWAWLGLWLLRPVARTGSSAVPPSDGRQPHSAGRQPLESGTTNGRPPALRKLLPGLLAGALLAAPGLWFAIRLTQSAGPELVERANWIYVFERLPHHLVPQRFKGEFVLSHLLLLASGIGLYAAHGRLVRNTGGRRWLAHRRRVRRLAAVVSGAVAIAVLGAVLAWATADRLELYASLMRYYWFRLSDALLPLGAALLSISLVHVALRWRPAVGQVLLGIALGVAGFHLLGYALLRPFPVLPRGDRENKVRDYASWVQACRWAAEHTPEDALFLTPRNQQTFKWHAGRPEIVTWKDVPQDASGIVAWWERMNDLHRTGPGEDPPDAWRKSLSLLPASRLRELAARYRAQYLLTESEPRLPFEILYLNDTYAIYRLPAGE
jgi:hypothetical protein